MRPLVLAHRGACWEVPENTLEAFELAIAEEADYVEFDVRARNGELVICHDPGPPEDVPTLEEVLAALTGRVGLCVEVKEEETTDAVLDALERHAVDPDELQHPRGFVDGEDRCRQLRRLSLLDPARCDGLLEADPPALGGLRRFVRV